MIAICQRCHGTGVIVVTQRVGNLVARRQDVISQSTTPTPTEDEPDRSVLITSKVCPDCKGKKNA